MSDPADLRSASIAARFDRADLFDAWISGLLQATNDPVTAETRLGPATLADWPALHKQYQRSRERSRCSHGWSSTGRLARMLKRRALLEI
jgi:hypothetical protein